MHPVHEVDAILLLSLSVAAKRRPAALAEILAAIDLAHGAIPSGAQLSKSFASLSAHGLIVGIDSNSISKVKQGGGERTTKTVHSVRLGVSDLLAGSCPLRSDSVVGGEANAVSPMKWNWNDGGYTLSADAQKMMGSQRKKDDTEKKILRLQEYLADYPLKGEHLTVKISPAQILAAVAAYQTDKRTSSKNSLTPKPKPKPVWIPKKDLDQGRQHLPSKRRKPSAP